MTNYIGTRCISELGRDCYEGLIPQTDTVGDRLTPLSRTRNRVCIPFCWMAPTSVSSCHRPGLDGHISRVAKPPGKEHGTVRDWAHGMTEMAQHNDKNYNKLSVWPVFHKHMHCKFSLGFLYPHHLHNICWHHWLINIAPLNRAWAVTTDQAAVGTQPAGSCWCSFGWRSVRGSGQCERPWENPC